MHSRKPTGACLAVPGAPLVARPQFSRLNRLSNSASNKVDLMKAMTAMSTLLHHFWNGRGKSCNT